jgi:uncharacterized membrane protein (DUF485 family)
VIAFTGKYWLMSMSLASTGRMTFGVLIVLSSFVLVMSFVRSRASLVFLMMYVVFIPLVTFVGLGLRLITTWWGWCIGLPMLMCIPVAVACYMWKSPASRFYYSRS